MRHVPRRSHLPVVKTAIVGALLTTPFVARSMMADDETTTPVKHLVVVFQENVSFDHYFATYPHAANPPGEPPFFAARGTPTLNGLDEALQAPNNPNAVQPFRLDRSQFQTCDQDHGYKNEQRAFNSGLMDRFVESVGRGAGNCQPGVPSLPSVQMTVL